MQLRVPVTTVARCSYTATARNDYPMQYVRELVIAQQPRLKMVREFLAKLRSVTRKGLAEFSGVVNEH